MDTTWFLQIISLSETLAWNLASAAWSWGNGECCWSGCPGALDWDLRWEEAVTCWPHHLGVKLRPDWTAERNREEDPVVAGCQDSCCSYWCFRRFSPIMFLYAYACTYIYIWFHQLWLFPLRSILQNTSYPIFWNWISISNGVLTLT